jgi:RNA-directed DNA polymerase
MTQEDFIKEWNAPTRGPHNPYHHLEDYATKTGKWNWDKLIWNRIRRRVFNIQKRIYKATVEGRYEQARNLMKLLSRSTCAIVLGVRKITQDNKGKNTPGVDGEKAETPAKRVRLVKRLLDNAQKGWDSYKAKPLKRKMIPKANGKKRPLSIPTIEDRAVQAVIKSALEPYYEAQFESCSYGFRPAMSAHDAISAIFNATHLKPKWVLDADIASFFDNINHEVLMRRIPAEFKNEVKQWLKAGYIEDNALHPTENGTPQGGIISPLLANVMLDDMQKYLRIDAQAWESPEGKPLGKTKAKKITVVRYADDFVIIHSDKWVIEKAKEWLQQWLRYRGLTLSEEKTSIVHTTEGFDFLGQTIKHHKNNHIKGHYRRQLLKDRDSNGKPKTDAQRRKDLRRVEKTHTFHPAC